MIGRLNGAVAEVGEEEALIDVGGVGYVVRCGSRTLARLPAPGDPALIHVESQFAEATGLRLYGFLTREERSAFVALQAIQGVGPKAALAVLDVLPPGELAVAAARQDSAAVARAHGVGPKLAQRIVSELKSKPLAGGAVLGAGFALAAPAHSPAGEALIALLGLGIAEPAARRALEAASARLGDSVQSPALIKAALQEIGR